jgi:hypothetical protein
VSIYAEGGGLKFHKVKSVLVEVADKIIEFTTTNSSEDLGEELDELIFELSISDDEKGTLEAFLEQRGPDVHTN